MPKTITLDENQVETIFSALSESHACVENLLADIESELQEGKADNAGILKLLQKNHTMVLQHVESAVKIIKEAGQRRN